MKCCIDLFVEFLGAERTKAKTKKKQWWRPWVDHASSRLAPPPSPFFHSDWPLCPWSELFEDSHSDPGLWGNLCYTKSSSRTLVLLCLCLGTHSSQQLSLSIGLPKKCRQNVVNSGPLCHCWSMVAVNRQEPIRKRPKVWETCYRSFWYTHWSSLSWGAHCRESLSCNTF